MRLPQRWSGMVSMWLLMALCVVPGSAQPVVQTELVDQVVVARDTHTGNTTGALWPWAGSRLRGYETLTFNLDPIDPTCGSQWVTLDVARMQPVVLIDDVNTACSQPTRANRAGQRITASRQAGDLLGTSPARRPANHPGAWESPGGHVLREGKDLGGLEPGWGVVKFDEHWSGQVWLAAPDEKPGYLMLAEQLFGAQVLYRLYAVLPTRLVPLGIEGGAELRGFVAINKQLFYRDAAGVLHCKALDSDAPAQPVASDQIDPAVYAATDPGLRSLYRGNRELHGGNSLDPTVQFAISAHDQLLRFCWSHKRDQVKLDGAAPMPVQKLALHQVDLWPRIWHFASGLRPDLFGGNDALKQRLEQMHLTDGFIAWAQDGRDGEAARLTVWLPGTEPVDLGPLAPCEGRALSRIYQLRITAPGDILVLAGDGQITALQRYESPLLQHATQLGREAMELVYGPDPQPPTTFRTIASMYDFAPQADRGYHCIAGASDGKVYFASMPHHPQLGSPLFRYDPTTDQVTMLGMLDELAGNTAPGHVPNMVHTMPVEMNQRLYFLGQDPFYGNRRFPGMSEETNQHLGSPLLALNLESNTFTMLGNPLPNELSLFGIQADPLHSQLYLRRGYWEKDQRWYTLPILPGGGMGALTPLPWPQAPVCIHVAADGKVYFPLTRPRTEQTPPDLPPLADVMRYDPQTQALTAIGTLDVRALLGDAVTLTRNGKLRNQWEWVLNQSADDPRLYAFNEETALLAQVDLETGAAVRVAQLLPEVKHYPVPNWGQVIRRGAEVYWLPVDVTHSRYRTTRLWAVNLETGQVRRLGVLKDQQGRWMQDVTGVAVGPDDRVYFLGQLYGLPEQRTFVRRSLYSAPYKLDSILGVLDPLPALER